MARAKLDIKNYNFIYLSFLLCSFYTNFCLCTYHLMIWWAVMTVYVHFVIIVVRFLNNSCLQIDLCLNLLNALPNCSRSVVRNVWYPVIVSNSILHILRRTQGYFGLKRVDKSQMISQTQLIVAGWLDAVPFPPKSQLSTFVHCCHVSSARASFTSVEKIWEMFQKSRKLAMWRRAMNT